MPTDDTPNLQPDYNGGGIVNLMSSVRQVFGAPDSHYVPFKPANLIQRLQDRSLILLVIDGLGYQQLKDHPCAPILNAHLVCSLTSVFPSTTASAITTFLTGLAPQQHGLVGWHTYFESIDCVFTPLPFAPRNKQKSLSADVTPATLFTHSPLFDLIAGPSHSVSPTSIAFSPYNQYHCGKAQIHPYKTVVELFEQLVEICRRTRQPTLTYAYYPTLDFLSHRDGSMSESVSQDLATLDHNFEQFLELAKGTKTTVVVTADHGFVDPRGEQRIDLADHPDIKHLLDKPLCGEPRVAYCYVKSGKQAHFEKLVEDRWSEALTLYPSEQLISEHYFGQGQIHPGLLSRIGDFTLVMKSEYMINDWQPGEKPFHMRGVHGGLSENEMLVPLVIADL